MKIRSERRGRQQQQRPRRGTNGKADRTAERDRDRPTPDELCYGYYVGLLGWDERPSAHQVHPHSINDCDTTQSQPAGGEWIEKFQSTLLCYQQPQSESEWASEMEGQEIGAIKEECYSCHSLPKHSIQVPRWEKREREISGADFHYADRFQTFATLCSIWNDATTTSTSSGLELRSSPSWIECSASGGAIMSASVSSYFSTTGKKADTRTVR